MEYLLKSTANAKKIDFIIVGKRPAVVVKQDPLSLLHFLAILLPPN